jgi:DNA-binding NarL/FixJ family response regulator
MNDRIAIFSIDDHEIIHQGIARMAERESDFVFLGATGKITNAESEVAAARPDIVMLDLFIGEDQGWSVCRDLVTSMPDTKVVFYTGYGNAQLVEKAMQLGASGFILKTSPLSDLPDLLRTVVRVGQCIDPSLLKEWVDSRRARTKAPDFNDQEILIVSMIADGLDNYVISERLHLSFHTVKFHIGKMLKRTGESNRAGLVRFAKEKFLID